MHPGSGLGNENGSYNLSLIVKSIILLLPIVDHTKGNSGSGVASQLHDQDRHEIRTSGQVLTDPEDRRCDIESRASVTNTAPPPQFLAWAQVRGHEPFYILVLYLSVFNARMCFQCQTTVWRTPAEEG